MISISELLKTPRMYYIPAEQYNNNCKGLFQMLCDIINSGCNLQDIAEIGCFSGVSTELFAKFGRVMAIDPFEVYSELDREKIEAAELKFNRMLSYYRNISHLKIRSDQIKIGMLFDLIYIDGAHDYQSVYNDCMKFKKYVRKGGYIAGHDWDLVDNVQKAVIAAIGKDGIKVYPDTSWCKKI